MAVLDALKKQRIAKEWDDLADGVPATVADEYETAAEQVKKWMNRGDAAATLSLCELGLSALASLPAQRLDLSGNKLDAFPVLDRSLTYLNVSGNSIILVPQEVLDHRADCFINLENNCLPPQEIERLDSITRSEDYNGPTLLYQPQKATALSRAADIPGWRIDDDARASGLRDFLAAQPAGHHLAGVADRLGGLVLRVQPGRPSADERVLARMALQKIVRETLYDAPAAQWSPSLPQDADKAAASMAPHSFDGTVGAAAANLAQLQNMPAAAEAGPSTPKIGAAIVTRIVEEVASRFKLWDHRLDNALGEGVGRLNPDNIVIALMMDALYKHHCQGVCHADNLPDDAELDQMFAQVCGALLEQPAMANAQPYLQRMATARFQPKLADTLQFLQDKFEEADELRAVPREARWRLLVEPQKLLLLGRHGIDTRNPLLANIYDAYPSDERRYANRLAKAWYILPFLKNRPLDEAARTLHHLASGAPIMTQTATFAAPCSREGIARIGDFMTRLRQMGIGSTLTVGTGRSRYQVCAAGEGVKLTSPSGDAGDTSRSEVRAPTLQQLLQREPVEKDQRVYCRFERLEAPGQSVEDKHASVLQLLRSALTPVQDIEQLPAGQVLPAVARMALDGDWSHVMANGNLRNFLQLMPNLLLMRAKQKISVPLDPAVMEGASYEQAEASLRAGQEAVAQWGARLPE